MVSNAVQAEARARSEAVNAAKAEARSTLRRAEEAKAAREAAAKRREECAQARAAALLTLNSRVRSLDLLRFAPRHLLTLAARPAASQF